MYDLKKATKTELFNINITYKQTNIYNFLQIFVYEKNITIVQFDQFRESLYI